MHSRSDKLEESIIYEICLIKIAKFWSQGVFIVMSTLNGSAALHKFPFGMVDKLN